MCELIYSLLYFGVHKNHLEPLFKMKIPSSYPLDSD